MAAKSLTTPIGTLSYPHLDKPQTDKKGVEKYSCALVFARGLDLSALRAAAIEAARDKFGSTLKLPGGKTIPVEQAFDAGLLRSPFRTDGLAKGYDEGSVFINVRSNQKPGVVGPNAKMIPESEIREKLYAGCQVRAIVAAFGYDAEGNKGVSFGLNHIQKVGEGERLDGRGNAENEFEAIAEAPADLSAIGA